MRRRVSRLAERFLGSILFAELAPQAAATVVAVWLAALGASVGSFLNVVIYRVPAGKSLAHPGSHCPRCKHPIRWYDNVPVLSWFVLRGRCRDCRSPISMRYPAVEAITAALFLVIGMVEGPFGGENLPPSVAAAVEEAPSHALAIGRSAALVGYHLVLLCTLLAAVLVEYDGHRPPARLFAPALLVGLLVPLCWPHLHPPGALPAWGPGGPGPVAAAVDAVAGLALGALLGLGLGRLAGGNRGPGLAWGPACVGLFLGWQAGLALTLEMVACWAVYRVLCRAVSRAGPIPPTAWLGLGALAWIVFWGPIVERWPFLG